MRRLRLLSQVLLIVVCTLILFIPLAFAKQERKLLWRAANELSADNYAVAEKLALEVLALNQDSPAAALIAGDAATGLHDHERAIQYYERVGEDAEGLTTLAHLGLGQRYLKLCNIEQAEANFEKVLEVWPENFEANKAYAYLLQVQGRSWESVEPTLRMIRQGNFGASDLFIVGSTEYRFLYEERFLDFAREETPQSIRPLLAELRNAEAEFASDVVVRQYEEIVEQKPRIIAPYVRLGRKYLDANDTQAYLQLESRLPKNADFDAGIWTNRGILAEIQGKNRQAVRCYYEALELSPNRVEPTYRLSQILSRLEEKKLALKMGDRAKQLALLELTADEFYRDPDPKRAFTLLQMYRKFDRHWEAAAICDMAMRYYREVPQWAEEELKKTAKQIKKHGDVLLPKQLLADLKGLKEYPLPTTADFLGFPETFPESTQTSSKIWFENRAKETGLEFSYFNSSRDPDGPGHIFETLGGGVVALDFDCDLWSDIFLAQGVSLWKPTNSEGYANQLFHNRQGNFQSISHLAGLGDADFSHGATTGDYNNDGFADLYVCNLHGNHFYENNGDGTFSEVSSGTGTEGEDWSTSSVLADLNGDSLPDLYVVNYLDREAARLQQCNADGVPLTCPPTLFSAAQDRIYQNLGNGDFEEVTQSAEIVMPDGKGLAILAADFDNTGKLSIFVGNDSTPNFLFSNRSGIDGSIKFAETGILSGLAFDGTGRSQATMGIAFGDITGSPDSELYITNFYHDPNALYLNESPGQFADITGQKKLREPSLQMLGFGTEFVDADLDGELDLFVTNGHVDKSAATGVPDKMLPQFFWNRGDGEFQLFEQGVVGNYFSKSYYGRTVSRLDWNRDGKDDLCVQHLDSPVALLTNETGETGNFLKIYLRGTIGARDAIGTIVEVKTSRNQITQQLVAGDGYMTSNERQLNFGLASEETVEDVSVMWPNGVQQTFGGLAGNQEYLIIQNVDHVFSLIFP